MDATSLAAGLPELAALPNIEAIPGADLPVRQNEEEFFPAGAAKENRLR
jgi:hypothetical protein